ncbi:hypothetical protein [Microbacterium sp. NPDC079208]|uniref:hypothetical protein n=1 Tax=Microbacterium sp. NPDC079208 TaxID=3154652 RepID=UPI00344FF791
MEERSEVELPGAPSDYARLTAAKWQRRSFDQWDEDSSAPGSMRRVQSEDFTSSVLTVFKDLVSGIGQASEVVEALEPTLSRCDALDFNDVGSTLAYLLWHQADRYHRVVESLHTLFRLGVLPIARPGRSLRVLEVGSGPAPATYAATHYYHALGRWAGERDDGFTSSISVEASTIDRGSAWGPLVHRLSETMMAAGNRASAVNLFATTYDNLVGFDPMFLHTQERERVKNQLVEQEPLDLYFGDDVDYDAEAAAHAPPSAYDLIVVANFLTNSSMMDQLEADLEVLARSLVPGGVLLTLSGTGPEYVGLWERFKMLPSVRRLDHVANERVQPHSDVKTRRLISEGLLDGIRHLSAVSQVSFADLGLPPDVYRALEVTNAEDFVVSDGVWYPSFALHAFKRGNRAISPKEQARMAKRRR